MLTPARKAILIQSVAQAIPIFTMNCFRLSKNLLHEINMMLVGFWWGDEGAKKKVHWVA